MNSLVACVIVSLAIFSTKRQIQYARKTKRHDITIIIIFVFKFLIISSAGSLLASKIFTVGKILQLSADHHVT